MEQTIKNEQIMKIAFVGPESSGKSSIIEKLSEEFDCTVIPEYAREYLSMIKTNYEYDDLEKIAKVQFNQINLVETNNLVLIDTELIVMKVWSEFKYAKCSNFILSGIEKQNIDFYFLCKPDFPWEFDELRENPSNRDEIFSIFENELKSYNFKYAILEGDMKQRLTFCKNLILTEWQHKLK
jgi:NadR type nicotinamide-nucleotide adenylyltransferase